jgi:ABC-type transport system substrate-binding protein
LQSDPFWSKSLACAFRGTRHKFINNKGKEEDIMRKIWWSVFVIACLWPALVIGAGQPVTGGTLIWGRGGDSVTLDLAQATDGESIKAGIQVFENLVMFGKDSMDVEPQLAESWKVSDDGLT